MDIGNIIIDALAVLVTCGVFFVWRRYIQPWIVDHNLSEAADVAVRAAQAIWGRYHGEEKLQAALDKLSAWGWDVSAESVVDAVRAAWQKMNTEQIASGEKTETVENSVEE